MASINKYMVIVLITVAFILVGCEVTLDNAVIKCNELTGECTIEEGISSNDDEDSPNTLETLDSEKNELSDY